MVSELDINLFVRRLGDWDGANVGTLGQRLALAISGAVEAGLLPQGTRLPPERQLATALHVSRPSVQAALAELRDRGVLAARQGSGTWVAGSSQVAGADLAEAALGGTGINLAASVPADALQLGDLHLSIGDLLGVSPLHGYAPLGLPTLRTAIAEFLTTRHGLASTAEEVIVTNGGHGALADVLGALVGPGEVVLTEQYTYPGLLDIVAETGAVAIPVKGDADGPDPAELARVARRRRPAAIVVSPVVNNPTGRSWSSERKAAIVDALAGVNTPIIDDAVLADLDCSAPRSGLGAAFEGSPLDARVVTIGSLSKTVWGGLRIGWIRCRRGSTADAVVRRRQRLDLGPSVPSQLLAGSVVARLPLLLPARNALVASRASYATTRLRDDLPTWDVEPSDGGLSLWCRLPLVDVEPFVAVAAAFGVEVFPGGRCRPDGGRDSHLRIGIDRPTPQLDQGITLLARAWATMRRP